VSAGGAGVGRSRRMPEWAHGLMWISPWILGTLLFLLIPIVMAARISFTDYSLIEPPAPVGLANYAEIARDGTFWTAVRNTAVYAVFAVVLGMAASVAIAVLLEQRLRGSGLVRALVFLPTLIPIVAASIGWMWLFNGQHGLFNAVLGAVGITGPDWLGDRDWAMPSLIIMSVWFIGSAVVINTAALREVPAALYEAAAIDGMTPWARFRHITLPMISPAVLFNAIMAAIWSLQVFAAPLIMTKGGPENATLVYSMYVFKNAFEYGRMGYASALAWVQFLGMVGVTAIALLSARRLVHYRTI
jgi:multiple sugar transport system permease protein